MTATQIWYSKQQVNTCLMASSCMLEVCCTSAACCNWHFNMSINCCDSLLTVISAAGLSTSLTAVSVFPGRLPDTDVWCWRDAASSSDCNRSISACHQQQTSFTSVYVLQYIDNKHNNKYNITEKARELTSCIVAYTSVLVQHFNTEMS